ncbi:hypothetical protein EVAR_40563_1 [Eumeta japonica]|uniref:Uncharacterized protein n=1 Tax=Eumeta variegata TaxID=151549 RepID=A0A4C1VWG7_EUMVA|nr:hypothetical protein EVAR_40563_1 [Eumeta japonica]
MLAQFESSTSKEYYFQSSRRTAGYFGRDVEFTAALVDDARLVARLVARPAGDAAKSPIGVVISAAVNAFYYATRYRHRSRNVPFHKVLNCCWKLYISQSQAVTYARELFADS